MRSLTVLIAILGIGSFMGCASHPGSLPETPDAASVTWTQYRHNDLGYSISYPEVFSVRERRGAPFFSYNGPTFFRVIDVTPAEARSRGLWGGHEPVASVRVGNRDGHKYVYEHRDFNEVRPMVAYVVDHDGKQLGIEFAMEDVAVLDPVRQRIIDSMQF